MFFRSYILRVLTLSLFAIVSLPAFSQSLTSGDITGVVLDPSGAVIPNASVTITNDGTGTTQTHTTNGEGAYRFSLLSPGTYTVSVSLQNFQKAEQKVAVRIGQ